MASVRAKILSMEVKQTGETAEVLFRFGNKEIAKPFPDGHAFVRGSAILDDAGNLMDAELITEKI